MILPKNATKTDYIQIFFLAGSVFHNFIFMSCYAASTILVGIFLSGDKEITESIFFMQKILVFLNSWIPFVMVLPYLLIPFWLYQKYSILQKQQILTPKYPLVMAIGGFVIPGINLFIPVMIFVEILQNLKQDILIRLTAAWWTTHVISMFFNTLLYFQDDRIYLAQSYFYRYLSIGIGYLLNLGDNFLLLFLVLKMGIAIQNALYKKTV